MRLLRDGGGVYVNGAENSTFESTMHDNFVDGDGAVFAVYYLVSMARHDLERAHTTL